MNHDMFFPFPNVNREISEIADPIVARSRERLAELADGGIKKCNRCKVSVCEHVEQSIHQVIERKALLLAADPQFVRDCKIVFIEHLHGQIQSNERLTIYLSNLQSFSLLRSKSCSPARESRRV